MARAQTEKYEELILDVVLDDAAPTVFTALCGITDVTVNRTSNVDTSEIPDCDDESLPMSLERQVRSQEVTVSGNGVFATQSWDELLKWWRSGSTKEVRIRNMAVGTGDIQIERGPALLTTLNQGRTKGQKVTAEIEIQFDGVPTTAVAA